METIKSIDGRYEIIHRSDYSGWAQIVEYQGDSPRREVSRTSVPMELISNLMDKMLFSVPAVVEPSKQELTLRETTLN